jgi:hypothetical protein
MGLAASALLHLLATGALDWPLAQVAIAPPPIEIQLQAPAPRPVALPQPRPQPQAVAVAVAVATPAVRPARRATPPAKPAHEEPAHEEPAAPESPAIPAEAAAPAVEAEAVPPSPPADEAATEPAEAPPARPNPLPHRIDIEYRLSVGPASGRQTVVWINEGDRYTLTSVAAATGLTRLFYAGSFVQTSRGHITPRGLQPEAFWDQRGDKHSSARFDAARGAITLTPDQGAPRQFAYEGEVQDLLSLLFQLALTAPAPDGQLGYTVFNGKKLRRYVYEVRGEEMLETALGRLRTLHLVRVGRDAERFEAWLAVDKYYLPVRVVRAEESGVEGELALSSIAVTE